MRGWVSTARARGGGYRCQWEGRVVATLKRPKARRVAGGVPVSEPSWPRKRSSLTSVSVIQHHFQRTNHGPCARKGFDRAAGNKGCAPFSIAQVVCKNARQNLKLWLACLERGVIGPATGVEGALPSRARAPARARNSAACSENDARRKRDSEQRKT